MSKRGTIAALKDMLEAVGRIERYVGSMSESEFLRNTEKQDAVIRNLEIIGEAARKLPAEFKQRHSQVQWAPIAGMRDRLIHQYFGVNWTILWDVVQNKLPELRRHVEQILAGRRRCEVSTLVTANVNPSFTSPSNTRARSPRLRFRFWTPPVRTTASSTSSADRS